jgi:hypothetical protein
MTTLMMMNLKNLSASSSDFELIDPTIYWQLIRSLKYLVNTRKNIFYAVSALIQFMRQIHWVDAKHVLSFL